MNITGKRVERARDPCRPSVEYYWKEREERAKEPCRPRVEYYRIERRQS